MRLRIDKFGRLLIPKILRRHLNVEPGDSLLVEINIEEQKVFLSALPKASAQTVQYTEYGFPIITGGEVVDEIDSTHPSLFIKETYDQYFQQKMGF